jgi:predicted hotdog family 3-hydroxylacyl-ACP dehydratase
MVLIDEILWVEESTKTAACTFRIGEDFFLLRDGRLPDVILIEIMAQASACLKGWIDVHRGLPVRIGYLVGIDEAVFDARPGPGDLLDVSTEMTEEISGYYRFRCSIEREKERVAHGLLSFIVP